MLTNCPADSPVTERENEMYCECTGVPVDVPVVVPVAVTDGSLEPDPLGVSVGALVDELVGSGVGSPVPIGDSVPAADWEEVDVSVPDGVALLELDDVRLELAVLALEPVIVGERVDNPVLAGERDGVDVLERDAGALGVDDRVVAAVPLVERVASAVAEGEAPVDRVNVPVVVADAVELEVADWDGSAVGEPGGELE